MTTPGLSFLRSSAILHKKVVLIGETRRSNGLLRGDPPHRQTGSESQALGWPGRPQAKRTGAEPDPLLLDHHAPFSTPVRRSFFERQHTWQALLCQEFSLRAPSSECCARASSSVQGVEHGFSIVMTVDIGHHRTKILGQASSFRTFADRAWLGPAYHSTAK